MLLEVLQSDTIEKFAFALFSPWFVDHAHVWFDLSALLQVKERNTNEVRK